MGVAFADHLCEKASPGLSAPALLLAPSVAALQHWKYQGGLDQTQLLHGI